MSGEPHGRPADAFLEPHLGAPPEHRLGAAGVDDVRPQITGARRAVERGGIRSRSSRARHDVDEPAANPGLEVDDVGTDPGADVEAREPATGDAVVARRQCQEVRAGDVAAVDVVAHVAAVSVDRRGLTSEVALQEDRHHPRFAVGILPGAVDIRVPQRHRIGEEGSGFVYQMLQFQEERIFAAISGIKSLEACVSQTIEYTRSRQAFGQSILDNQVVHFRLAELQTEIEALRALCYGAVEAYIHGEDVTLKASMAKLKIGRLSREVTDACLQYWGGMGFMWDNPVSRAWRDTRLASIGGGADEVMLSIICKLMDILPRRKKGEKP